MAKKMEEEYISSKMVQSTLVVGRKTDSMDMVSRLGLMNMYMKETLKMGKSMAQASLYRLKAPCLLESSNTICKA